MYELVGDDGGVLLEVGDEFVFDVEFFGDDCLVEDYFGDCELG